MEHAYVCTSAVGAFSMEMPRRHQNGPAQCRVIIITDYNNLLWILDNDNLSLLN